jgi:citrate synthase
MKRTAPESRISRILFKTYLYFLEKILSLAKFLLILCRLWSGQRNIVAHRSTYIKFHIKLLKYTSPMDALKQKFLEKAAALAAETKILLKEHGSKKIDDVTLEQVYGGMRDITSMLYETSLLDPIEGIRFRGFSIPELRDKLPKAKGGKEPLPEGLFWLLLTGEVPTDAQVDWLNDEWTRRSAIPKHTFRAINALPIKTHPMTQLTVAISSMQTESIFAKRYDEGMGKSEYAAVTYEDTMNLIAKLPQVAAYIYRRTYHQKKHIAPNPALDWGANFAHMLGIDSEEFKELMRLYLVIHADHEGGNASAHTTHLVGSTLSDVYYSLASGMNALAGPLHGLANQEVIKWVLKMLESIDNDNPTKEQITDYVHKTLSEGKVVPGYGHAVLRRPDPRFIAQKEFAEANIPNATLVNVIWKVYDVVPGILGKIGKIKNPYPNVDAHSGALLVHYGLKEYGYYTVLFGVSRALGVLAAACWSRALSLPLERPKSVTTDWVKEYLAKEAAAVVQA